MSDIGAPASDESHIGFAVFVWPNEPIDPTVGVIIAVPDDERLFVDPTHRRSLDPACRTQQIIRVFDRVADANTESLSTAEVIRDHV